jgi:polar amino acid transport system substrate-binding protein
MTPDERLVEAMTAEGIIPGNQDDIRAYLTILKNRDEKTYEHSIRVGILASKMAIYYAKPGVNSRMMLWAGCLHDIGKTLIAPELLAKKEGFTAEDKAAMEPHVIYGYEMLQGVHDFTAAIIVQHHTFGAQPYPKFVPPMPGYMGPYATIINRAARLLALADYYDALMHRDNDKNGSKPLTSAERREIYLRDNADEKEFIELVESLGVVKF